MPPTQEQDWVGYFEIQEPSLSLSHPPNLQGLNVHIRNVFAEGDLTPESVVKDFFTTAECLQVAFKSVINYHGQMVVIQPLKESGYVHLSDRTFQSQ